VVCIHCPKTPETVGMFNAARFARMKPSAYIINTARGGIIDEAALHAALSAKKLAGAGIDVFAIEPIPLDHPLRKLDNVVLTPHLGYVTEEGFRNHYRQMVEGIGAWFKGEPLRRLA
jgi:D-3-phosphoglycerate dehydrogenase